MKKSILNYSLLLILPLLVMLSSCSDDDDTVQPSVTAPAGNNNGNTASENYFMINGGPFSNVKLDYASASLIRAWNYTSDSTILYFNRNSTDYATVLLNGNQTGTYSWSTTNKLEMIFQYNGAYYTVSCNELTPSGSVVVSVYGVVGSRVKGTLTATGTAKDAITGTHYPINLSGKFDLLRAN